MVDGGGVGLPKRHRSVGCVYRTGTESASSAITVQAVNRGVDMAVTFSVRGTDDPERGGSEMKRHGSMRYYVEGDPDWEAAAARAARMATYRVRELSLIHISEPTRPY